MAYSDYGGYAYKDGKRVEDRSDAVLSLKGIKSTPGAWPGWTIEEGRSGGSYHVLLGDGPIFVGLYKQSSLSVFRLGEALNVCALAKNPVLWEEGELDSFIDTDHYCETGEPLELEVDGHKITVHWVHEENHYIFVRLEQPNGSVWHGWSGYGVGAGLEDGGHGFSTPKQEQRLVVFWPDAIAE